MLIQIVCFVVFLGSYQVEQKVSIYGCDTWQNVKTMLIQDFRDQRDGTPLQETQSSLNNIIQFH